MNPDIIPWEDPDVPVDTPADNAPEGEARTVELEWCATHNASRFDPDTVPATCVDKEENPDLPGHCEWTMVPVPAGTPDSVIDEVYERLGLDDRPLEELLDLRDNTPLGAEELEAVNIAIGEAEAEAMESLSEGPYRTVEIAMVLSHEPPYATFEYRLDVSKVDDRVFLRVNGMTVNTWGRNHDRPITAGRGRFTRVLHERVMRGDTVVTWRFDQGGVR